MREADLIFPEDQAKAKKMERILRSDHAPALDQGSHYRVAALHEQLLLNWAAKQTKKRARQNFSFKLKAYNG
jgi:hypothetical protein